MSWSNAVDNLRTILSDGPTDKLRANKQVFGMQNGTNTTFKTFEFRRLTDFSASALAFPLGLYSNNRWLGASAVTLDDPNSGYFQAASAYDDSVKLTCAYYVQWFTDAELDTFLVQASRWIGGTGNYSEIIDGLQTAALKYAQSQAYYKLALRMAENMSETFRLEDSPDEKRFTIVDAYNKAGKVAMDEAEKYRDDYYERKGAAKAPRSGTIQGRIKNPTIS